MVEDVDKSAVLFPIGKDIPLKSALKILAFIPRLEH